MCLIMTKLFKENCKTMTEYEYLKGKYTQILVLNYLKHKYKENNLDVYLYNEIINDVDVFNKPIDYNILKQDKPTIETFINMLSSESINLLETLEVKHVREFMFKNIIQVLTKFKYPLNVKIKLVYIPISTRMENELLKLIDEFNKYKQAIVNLNENDRYSLYNNFINGTHHYNENILFVIKYWLNMLIKYKIKNDYEHNISTDDFIHFDNNFKKFDIDIITKKQLVEYQIDNDITYDIIGYQEEINDDDLLSRLENYKTNKQ